MMRTKPKSVEMLPKKSNLANGREEEEEVEWELRPGGMLVQKRDPDSDRKTVVPAPTIRVRVKHGSAYHEIYVNSQANFGELKKLLASPTGVHPQDQKLFFKDKERDSKNYLDIVGVKERSKIVLVEDPTSQERRYLEMRKTAKLEKASKSVSEISLEVDKLGNQVSALESIVAKGGKVVENDVLNLTESLMTLLIKLDGIIADGDVKLQRRMQVKRVQKYVETLDLLKIQNAKNNNNGIQTTISSKNATQTPTQSYGNGSNNGNRATSQRTTISSNKMSQIPTQRNAMSSTNGSQNPIIHERHTVGQFPKSSQNYPQEEEEEQQQRYYQQQQRQTAEESVVVTEKWETFDSLLPYPSTSNGNGTTTTAPAKKLNWEFFE